MQPDNAVQLMRCIAQVSEIFIEIAEALRSIPGSASVVRQINVRREEKEDDGGIRVGQGTGFCLDWYAEADFEDGRGLTFAESLSWHEEWVVGGSVVLTTGDGQQDDLMDLPTRYAVDIDDLCVELVGQARLLRDGREAIAMRFVSASS